MSVLTITILLTVVASFIVATASLIRAFSCGRKDIHAYQMSIGKLIFFIPVTTIFGTIGASLITIPFSLFLFGSWGWPFADWSPLIQIGVIIPFLVSLFAGIVALVLDWTKNSSRDRLYGEPGLKARVFTVSFWIGGAGLVWMIAIAPAIALVSLSIDNSDRWLITVWGLVVCLPLSTWLIGITLPLTRERFEDFWESLIMATCYFWFPFHIAIFLIGMSPLFLIVIVPVGVVLLAIMADGSGGGYDSGPVTSWFISK